MVAFSLLQTLILKALCTFPTRGDGNPGARVWIKTTQAPPTFVKSALSLLSCLTAHSCLLSAPGHLCRWYHQSPVGCSPSSQIKTKRLKQDWTVFKSNYEKFWLLDPAGLAEGKRDLFPLAVSIGLQNRLRFHSSVYSPSGLHPFPLLSMMAISLPTPSPKCQ